MPYRALVIDDDPAMGEVLALGLPRRGYEVTTKTSAESAFAVLMAEDFDVVVTDVRMHGENGLDLCSRIVANRPDVPVVVITAFGSLETAVAAIRAGAWDFVTKPFDLDTLQLVLDRAVKHRVLQTEVRRLRQEVATHRDSGELIGSSPAMGPVHDLLDRLRDSEVSVLITGESGTGKEVVARALHRSSHRSEGPFVAVNCAALPEALLESELFGHKKGAFTDARDSRTGLFLQANGGTLFLDEVGEMPLPLQVKLLRALQERKVRPVGADAEVAFDTRLLSATNRDLQRAIEDGRFREDLYFRLDVVHVELPPLRARGNDILLLAQHSLARFAAEAHKPIKGISPTAAAKLLAYSWPGNVRELQNCVERAVALARFEEITVEDLPEKIRRYDRTYVLVEGSDPEELVTIEEVERRYVLKVLEAVAGNRTQAAKILGLDRKTLYRKLERYGYDDRDAKD